MANLSKLSNISQSKWLPRGLFLSCLFTLLVIALGSYTRLMHAGLGCPDWPGCYGKMFIAGHGMSQSAWIEMIHRYFAGSLGFMMIIMLGFTLTHAIKTKQRVKQTVIISFFILALLAYQILLGRWTVTLQLHPAIVSQHLLSALILLSLLWILYLTNKQELAQATASINKNYFYAAIFGIVILFIQVFLGVWTSANYASLSCPDFPFCHHQQTTALQWQDAFQLLSPIGINYEGGVLPLAARQAIQMTHRLGAVLIAAYLFILCAMISLKYNQNKILMKPVCILLALLSIQLCLGIANVLFALPLYIAISHTLTAGLLLLSLISITITIKKGLKHEY